MKKTDKVAGASASWHARSAVARIREGWTVEESKAGMRDLPTVIPADDGDPGLPPTIVATEYFRGPEIKTPCPSCGLQGLFVTKTGHLVCGVVGCKNPSPEDYATAAAKRADAAEKAQRGTHLSLSLLRCIFSHPGITDAEKAETARRLLGELLPPPTAA